MVSASTRGGDPIEKGDHVQFVHFGELHEAVVDAIEEGAGAVPTLVVKVEARVPAFAANVLKKAKTAPEKHQGSTHTTHTAKPAEKGKNT